MQTVDRQQPNSLPAALNVPIWLAVFLSPTGYIVFLMFADRLHVPAPPDGLVVALFVLIPFAALATCSVMVWRSNMSLRWRIGGVLLTLLAMLLQCGFLFVVIVSVISVVISPV